MRDDRAHGIIRGGVAMFTRSLVIALVVASSTRAEADPGFKNALIGPVFGIRLGGHAGPRAVFGVEGGVGLGPERVNLGFEHRDGKVLAYAELDPWYLVGFSLGLGIDSDGEPAPVLGVWEGLPIRLPECGSVSDLAYASTMTIAGGYRYTGVHELYVTIKAGVSQPFCLDN